MENNKVWLARDKDCSLYVYKGKPILGSGNCFIPGLHGECMILPRDSYVEVTYENSPLPMEVLLDYGK